MSAPEIVACEGHAHNIKPLEWRDLTDRLSGSLYYSAAETPMGGIRAAKITDGKWTVEIFGRKLRNYLDSVETYSTLHEAKAAAEADYTASVLACLERALETEAGGMASRLQEANTYVDEEHALATPAASPSPAPAAVEPVAWIAIAHSQTGMGTIVGQRDWAVTDDANRLYGKGRWDLHPLIPATALSTLAAVNAALRSIIDQQNVERTKDAAEFNAAVAERDTLRRSHASAEQALLDVVAERDAALREKAAALGLIQGHAVIIEAAEARASALESELDKTRYALVSLIWLPAVRAAIDALPPDDGLRKMAELPTMQDLIRVFEEAKNQATPEDNLRGDASKWGTVRGIKAVKDLIMGKIALD